MLSVVTDDGSTQSGSLIDEIVRDGARRMPAAALEAQVSAFVAPALLRACARLVIKLIHSTPGRPQGRGKIERFFRTVREQFLVKVDTEKVTSWSSTPST